MIETLMSKLLNIEIIDLHTRLIYTEKDIEKIRNALENTVKYDLIVLRLLYH